MIKDIGSICDSSGHTLLKMWNVKVPAGKRIFQRHHHVNFEISFVCSGSGIYTTKEHTHHMSPGDFFVFSSNEFHCITEVGITGLEMINLQFEPRYLWGNSTDSLSEENSNICFSHNKDFHNRISADSSEPIRNHFIAIKNELETQNPEFSLIVKSELNYLLVSLVRCFNYSDNSTTLSRNYMQSFRKVLIYIEKHLGDALSLTDLSHIAGFSPNYFSSLFRKINGITLWDYINSKRIDRAIKLISENSDNKTMLEIALMCGFNNTANFNKAFKKFTGVTPSEYPIYNDLFTL